MGEFIWKPVDYVTEPQGNYVEVLRDRWWVTNDKGEVALFRFSPRESRLFPQCNGNKEIAEKVGASTKSGGTGVTFIPLAFVTIDPSKF